MEVRFPFQLHLSAFEGNTVEQLISAATEPDPRLLDAAVIEAAYAFNNPALLPRLRFLRIPYALDPQTLRFANEGFVRRPSLVRLPYAPSKRLRPPAWDDRVERTVRGAMEFAAEHDADFYLAPALPLYRPTLPEVKAFEAAQNAAYDCFGESRRKPVYAYVGASSAVLKSPFAVYERLLDRPFAGVYVQPLRLHPRQDSVEALVAYAAFLLEGKRYGFEIMAGHAGTFGLLLMALGVDAVDSGLGDRETYDLGALDREPNPTRVRRGGGGRARSVYLAPLLTTLPAEAAKRLVRHPSLRARFICELGECQYLDLEAQIDNPRAHFFHSRPAELAQLRDRPNLELRIQLIGQRLRSAVDLATTVNRVLDEDSQPLIALDHLKRWSSVLTRMAAVLATRRDQ
jgi:hypothetical protein